MSAIACGGIVCTLHRASPPEAWALGSARVPRVVFGVPPKTGSYERALFAIYAYARPRFVIEAPVGGRVPAGRRPEHAGRVRYPSFARYAYAKPRFVIEAPVDVCGPAGRRPEHAGRVRYPRQVVRQVQRSRLVRTALDECKGQGLPPHSVVPVLPDRGKRRLYGRIAAALFALLTLAAPLQAARLEILRIEGATLRDNPLGDPAARRVAIFVPDGSQNSAPLPLVIYLPGWGGSSEDAIAAGQRDFLGQVVDRLAKEGHPVRIASVDGRSRYGGSQFLNSTATGKYADCVADEIQPALLARYAAETAHPKSCLVAGHSSGAYGALLLAMSRQARFHAVVALSPDSDFEVTHKAMVQQPNVRRVTPRELEDAMAAPGKARLPQDGLALLVMGLCANYAPDEARPGRFEWLYDAQGNWRAETWRRWIELDPLTVIRRRPDAFGPAQRVYLDGPERDSFGANLGARAMYDVLGTRRSPVTFHQPPGGHSDQLPERLARGLKWALGGGVEK
jgi:S-formylglutathione hydrolase FrmB